MTEEITEWKDTIANVKGTKGFTCAYPLKDLATDKITKILYTKGSVNSAGTQQAGESKITINGTDYKADGGLSYVTCNGKNYSYINGIGRVLEGQNSTFVTNTITPACLSASATIASYGACSNHGSPYGSAVPQLADSPAIGKIEVKSAGTALQAIPFTVKKTLLQAYHMNEKAEAGTSESFPLGDTNNEITIGNTACGACTAKIGNGGNPVTIKWDTASKTFITTNASSRGGNTTMNDSGSTKTATGGTYAKGITKKVDTAENTKAGIIADLFFPEQAQNTAQRSLSKMKFFDGNSIKYNIPYDFDNVITKSGGQGGGFDFLSVSAYSKGYSNSLKFISGKALTYITEGDKREQRNINSSAMNADYPGSGGGSASIFAKMQTNKIKLCSNAICTGASAGDIKWSAIVGSYTEATKVFGGGGAGASGAVIFEW